MLLNHEFPQYLFLGLVVLATIFFLPTNLPGRAWSILVNRSFGWRNRHLDFWYFLKIYLPCLMINCIRASFEYSIPCSSSVCFSNFSITSEISSPFATKLHSNPYSLQTNFATLIHYLTIFYLGILF